jgi:hypothetical protein
MEDHGSVVSGASNSVDNPGMSFGEKVREWSVADPTSVEESDESGAYRLVAATPSDQILSNCDLDEMDDENGPQSQGVGPETTLSDLDAARINFAVNTSSFSWLLKAVKSRSQLDYSVADSLESIRETASSILSQYRGNRALWPQRVGVRMAWDPRLFIQQQEYEGSESIITALTITGTAMKAQLTSCRDYLNQVWPLTGEAVLEGIIAAAKDETPVRRTLFDGMQFSVELINGGLQIECIGLFDSIVDVIEVLAWIGSTLRESSAPNKIRYSTTEMKIGKKAIERNLPSEVFLVFAEDNIPDADTPPAGAGGCWLHGLLRNPVIAKGFPTPLRPDDTPGLETPVEAIALLVDASQLNVFNNRALLKGFNAAAVPTAYKDTVIQWHLILNEDGSRLQYGDVRIAESPEVSPTQAVAKIHGARHILGWTSAAAYNIGEIRPWLDMQLVHADW